MIVAPDSAEAASDEGEWRRRRLPWTVCKGRRGVGGRREGGGRSLCGGDGGLWRGRGRRRGLGMLDLQGRWGDVDLPTESEVDMVDEGGQARPAISMRELYLRSWSD